MKQEAEQKRSKANDIGRRRQTLFTAHVLFKACLWALVAGDGAAWRLNSSMMATILGRRPSVYPGRFPRSHYV